MPVDMEKFNKNFIKEISNWQAMVARAADILIRGSFSQRRPDLGPMVRCPFCHVRRHAFSGVRCCNAKYATTQRAHDPEFNQKGEAPKEQGRGFGPTTRHLRGFYQTQDMVVYKPGVEREPAKKSPLLQSKRSKQSIPVETEERKIEAMFPQSFMKRFSHKRHGQSRAWKIRQLLTVWQQTPLTPLPGQTDIEADKRKRIPEAALQAAVEMQAPFPLPEHLPNFAEKYWLWKQKRQVRAERLFRRAQ